MTAVPESAPSGVSFRGGTLEGKIAASVVLPEFFPLDAGSLVLNVGCGEGPQAIAYRGRYARMVGADFDFDRLRFASRTMRERRVPDVSFVRCDAERLPFPDRSYDAVLAVDLLEHLLDPDAALREARRVLRPGGRLLASYPLLFDAYDDLFERIARARSRLFRRARRTPTVSAWDRHRIHRSAGEWKKAFEASGLEIVAMRASTLFPPLHLLGVRRFWFDVGTIRRVDAALARIPGLRRIGQAMLVACRRSEADGSTLANSPDGA